MSPPRSDYRVGYGKPPEHTRFRKGQSGNPRGRPRGSESLARVLHRVLDEKIVVRENGERRKMTKLEAMLKQLANKGLAGDLRAIWEVLKLPAIGAAIEPSDVTHKRFGSSTISAEPLPDEEWERRYGHPDDPAQVEAAEPGLGS